MENSKKILLVLDLDETLVHTTSGFKVHLRPGVYEFLDECFKHFEVAIWSSGGDEYVHGVVNSKFSQYPFKFVWTIRRCTFHIARGNNPYEEYIRNPYDNGVNIKQLRKVSKAFNISLQHILIVDDTPEKCIKNYGNAIYIREFNLSSVIRGNDIELTMLMKYLLTLKDVDNVRCIEKRYWRDSIYKEN